MTTPPPPPEKDHYTGVCYVTQQDNNRDYSFIHIHKQFMSSGSADLIKQSVLIDPL